jgi:hypothetical protein
MQTSVSQNYIVRIMLNQVAEPLYYPQNSVQSVIADYCLFQAWSEVRIVCLLVGLEFWDCQCSSSIAMIFHLGIGLAGHHLRHLHITHYLLIPLLQA